MNSPNHTQLGFLLFRKGILVLVILLGLFGGLYFTVKYITKTTPHQIQLTELEEEMKIVEFDTNNPAAKDK